MVATRPPASHTHPSPPSRPGCPPDSEHVRRLFDEARSALEGGQAGAIDAAARKLGAALRQAGGDFAAVSCSLLGLGAIDERTQGESSPLCVLLLAIAEGYFLSCDSPPVALDRQRATPAFMGMVGSSPPMEAVFRQIRGVAGAPGGVFITGETGTGKELVARALHDLGREAGSPFVSINCAALPRELIESELFGHEKGAFTGGHAARVGLLRQAGRGTFFLDEVTEMPMELQAKLLRALEQRLVRPVGSSREQPVEARFVASTNRNPAEAIQAGLLRQDLYYRLSVYRVDLPPLRNRPDDISALVAHFGAQHPRGADVRIDPMVMEVLQRHRWPGNVREFRNVIEHALTTCEGPVVRLPHLPPYLTTEPFSGRSSRPPPVSVDPPPRAPVSAPVCPESLPDLERRLLLDTLAACGGNKSLAAKRLGISRHQIYTRLSRLTGEAG